MLWLSDPSLAFELATSRLMILFCKVGPWAVWPTVTLIMARRRT
jgi:hypothetical protein